MAKIKDPSFNEYVYFLLYNGTLEQKRKVTRHYAEMFNSQKKARNFSRTASLESKLELLKQLEIKYFFAMIPGELEGKKNFRAFLKKASEGDDLEVLKTLIEHKVFITSDKEMVYLLETASSAVHSDIYEATLNFFKKPYHELSWNKKLGQETKVADVRDRNNEILEYNLRVNKSMLSSYTYFGLEKEKLWVLKLLATRKNSYVSAEEISKRMGSAYTSTKAAGALNLLEKQGYVKCRFNENQRYGTITAAGIMLIDKYIEKLLKDG